MFAQHDCKNSSQDNDRSIINRSGALIRDVQEVHEVGTVRRLPQKPHKTLKSYKGHHA